MTIVEEFSDVDELEVAGLRWMIPDMYKAVRAARDAMGSDVAVVFIVKPSGRVANSYHGKSTAMMGALADECLFLHPAIIGGEQAIENLWMGVPDPGHNWVLVVHGFHVFSVLLKLDIAEQYKVN